MTVRSKWYCSSKEEVPFQSSHGKVGYRIKFGVVYEGTADDDLPATKENRIFGDATPSGTIEMFIANKAAADQYTAGECYYFDSNHAGQPEHYSNGYRAVVDGQGRNTGKYYDEDGNVMDYSELSRRVQAKKQSSKA